MKTSGKMTMSAWFLAAASIIRTRSCVVSFAEGKIGAAWHAAAWRIGAMSTADVTGSKQRAQGG